MLLFLKYRIVILWFFVTIFCKLHILYQIIKQKILSNIYLVNTNKAFGSSVLCIKD